jgi:hypothetical protein
MCVVRKAERAAGWRRTSAVGPEALCSLRVLFWGSRGCMRATVCMRPTLPGCGPSPVLSHGFEAVDCDRRAISHPSPQPRGGARRSLHGGACRQSTGAIRKTLRGEGTCDALVAEIGAERAVRRDPGTAGDSRWGHRRATAGANPALLARLTHGFKPNPCSQARL